MAQRNSCAHKEQRKEAVTPQETEPDLLANCGGVGQEWLSVGIGALAAAVLEGAPWHKSSWSLPLILPYTPRLCHPRPKN